jgi:hypothetical protein
MNEQETWKPIKNFEGLYDVSDQGRVYSYYRDKIMSPGKDKNGYLHINFCKNGKMFGKLLHKLVAETFLQNPEGNPEVHHINEDKNDNRVSNLQYVSRQYNIEFSQAGYCVLYDENDERKEIYNIRKFARENGLDSSHLRKVANGKMNSYMGYTAKSNTEYTKLLKGTIKLISPEGKIMTFQSQPEAANFIGCCQQYISLLVKGRVKSCKGWTLPEQ